jgi:hypothetical protein
VCAGGRRVIGAGVGIRARFLIRENLKGGFAMSHDIACALAQLIEGLIAAYIEMHRVPHDAQHAAEKIIDLRTELIETLQTVKYRRTQDDKMYEGAVSIAEHQQKRADALAAALKRVAPDMLCPNCVTLCEGCKP